MSLTQLLFWGKFNLIKSADLMGLTAHYRLLRHNALLSAFFYGQAGAGSRKACQFCKVAGLSTRNRLAAILTGVGQVLRKTLTMTQAVIAQTRTLTLQNLNHTINHEPRVLDLDIAEALGFARPRKIRDIIERNKAEIEAYGSIAPRRGDYKGHSFTEYFLNESQAILVSMLSRTPNAAIVRKQLIEVFQAYKQGLLTPQPQKPAKGNYEAIDAAYEALLSAYTRMMRFRHKNPQASALELQADFEQGAFLPLQNEWITARNAKGKKERLALAQTRRIAT